MESGHPGRPSRRQVQIPISTPPRLVVDVYDQDQDHDEDHGHDHNHDYNRNHDDHRGRYLNDPEPINIDIDVEPEPDALAIQRQLNRDSSKALRNSSTSNLLCPPSPTAAPTFAMGADGSDTGDAAGSSPATTASTPNPFNFKTQVISTGPVKSVRCARCPLHIITSSAALANISARSEHRPASRPQIQAQ